MKRMILILLALALTLPLLGGALADGAPWPVVELEGTAAEMKPEYLKNQRRQAMTGPARDYAQAGAYLPRRVVDIRALLREGEYILVDLTYANAKRCLYFHEQSLYETAAEQTQLKGYPARTLVNMPVFYGPGPEYDYMTYRARSPFAAVDRELLREIFNGNEAWIKKALKDEVIMVSVRRGTPIQVFFETKGWVFAEFSAALGKARGWMRADQVAAAQ